MGVNGIYGLASGLDVDSLVTQAMQAKQKQYDSIYKKEQRAEWTKDAYNSWYEKLTDFQNNTLWQYSLSSGMDPHTATSSDNSIVTAKAGGAAANMSHHVAVESLASNAYLKSVGEITRPSGTPSDSIKLSDIVGITNVNFTAGTDNSTDDKLSFDMDGSHYELNGSEMDETAISFTVRDGTTTKDIDNGTESNTSCKVSFSYRDLVEGTLNDVASKLSNGGTNVNAGYDSVNDTFSIYNNKGGVSNFIDLTVDDVPISSALANKGITIDSNEHTRTLLSALNLGQYDASNDSLTAIDVSNLHDTPDNLNSGYSGAEFKGTDGKVKIDGKEYTTDSSGITVDGVSYTLLADSDYTLDANNNKVYKNSVVSVSTDTDTIVKNVKQFVDDYNKMLSDLKDAVNTEPDSNYQPLTDTEKKAMSEDQIKAWETKAKQGLLYKDNSLTDLISSIRSAVNEPIAGIGGKYNSLNNIGISVSAEWTSEKSGVLSLDETKLKSALAEDPNVVYKIFDNPAADKSDSSTYGVVKRLNQAVTDAIGTGDIATASGIRGMAGVSDSSDISDQSYWAKEIVDWKKKLSSFQDSMDKYQDKLYSQFDAMETAISNLSSQYSYISSFLS
ncbi:flagellar filament capping protein FliD [Pectinatus sottacetonis]|uniref:flagellar filament capping protein FliD n=1 Tax=Pectinatus sottacetonis TaxID=1002795 RepID=UPI0018C846C9|nr:flagellar filament capping protein FliD [Pectinatus sottacetonis]